MEPDELVDALWRAIQAVDSRYLSRWDRCTAVLNGLGLQGQRRAIVERRLSQRSERLFCYELYHRWRVETAQRLYPGVWLDAEPRKEFVRAGFPAQLGERGDTVGIPDFVVHEPEGNGRQQLVVEVKFDPDLGGGRMREDVGRVVHYMQTLGFRQGCVVAGGISHATWRRRMTHIANRPCWENLDPGVRARVGAIGVDLEGGCWRDTLEGLANHYAGRARARPVQRVAGP